MLDDVTHTNHRLMFTKLITPASNIPASAYVNEKKMNIWKKNFVEFCDKLESNLNFDPNNIGKSHNIITSSLAEVYKIISNVTRRNKIFPWDANSKFEKQKRRTNGKENIKQFSGK